MRGALSFLRGTLGRDDRRVAFRSESRAMEAAAARPGVDARFRTAMQRAANEPSVLLGHAVRDPTLEVRLTLAELLAHVLVLGASGSGKTRLICWVVLFVLQTIARAPDRLGLVLCDFKGEFVELVKELVQDLVETLPDAQARAILDRWVVFNPFSTTSLLPMQLLERDPVVPPEIQAAELVSVVERLGGGGLGVKQDSYTYALLLFGITEELTLLDLRALLADLPTLESRARASTSLEVRQTLGAATKLARASLDGVRARFDRLLRLPSMRLMLGARTCTPFRKLLNDRILVVDVGSPPLGCSDLGAFWSGFINLKLTRAIFERSKADAARPVLVMIDEWQQGLAAGPDVAEEFERVLSMARSREVHFWMISQSLAGAAKVSTSLPEVVATNTALQFLGRASIKDARAMKHILPVTGRCPRAAGAPWEAERRAPFLSLAEERERLVELVPNQTSRTFYLWERRRPHRAELVRVATLDPGSGGFRSVAISERLRDGVLGVPIAELDWRTKRNEWEAFEPTECVVLKATPRKPGLGRT